MNVEVYRVKTCTLLPQVLGEQLFFRNSIFFEFEPQIRNEYQTAHLMMHD
jgi:hypothetical protein